ncbi:MAG: hypothetical protein KGI69_02085 [Patescibacteria group bacterium]|nr:hypothetical protein [Patescibacteria group bacterium]
MKEHFLWEPEVFAGIIGKLMPEADRLGISKEEALKAMLPELNELMDSIEATNDKMSKNSDPWQKIPRKYQESALLEYYAWHYFWVCLSGVPKKEKARFDSAAKSRLKYPKKARAKISKHALVYAIAKLTEKERERLFGAEYMECKKKSGKKGRP